MSKLESKHTEVKFDGMKWIKIIRDKTCKEISVPLLPMVISILQKYQTHQSTLPLISNQKIVDIATYFPYLFVKELLKKIR